MEATGDIPGYEGLYEIDTSGEVHSIRSRKLLKKSLGGEGYTKGQGFKIGKGYEKVHLYNAEGMKAYLVHRLVALVFCNNPHNYPQVNHINGMKTDNRAENLEWCDAKGNMRHAREILGFSVVGEDHPNARMTEKEVKLIHHFKKCNPEVSHETLAEAFKVSPSHIKNILSGHRWAHLKP